jgi:hypothetical protein
VFISRSTVLTLNALRPCFLIHLSTLYLVTSHQIGNKKRIIRENLRICTAVLVSVLFHLHGFSGLSFPGNVLLPTSLLVRPFKQPFLVPYLNSIMRQPTVARSLVDLASLMDLASPLDEAIIAQHCRFTRHADNSNHVKYNMFCVIGLLKRIWNHQTS